MSVQVFESHQSSKKDTSGTAKAVVASFNKLGLQFDESQVWQAARQMAAMAGGTCTTSCHIAQWYASEQLVADNLTKLHMPTPAEQVPDHVYSSAVVVIAVIASLQTPHCFIVDCRRLS